MADVAVEYWDIYPWSLVNFVLTFVWIPSLAIPRRFNWVGDRRLQMLESATKELLEQLGMKDVDYPVRSTNAPAALQVLCGGLCCDTGYECKLC